MRKVTLFSVVLIIYLMLLSSCKKSSNDPQKAVKYLTENIDNDTKWYADTVYVIKQNIAITGSLTIESGTIVKLGYPKSLVFSGTNLVAIGNKENPIIFTSIYDDEHGGDTDDDGGTIKPKTGDWLMVGMQGAYTKIRMEDCQFLYGGCVLPETSLSLSILNCTFAHCDGSYNLFRRGALNIGYTGNLEFSHNLFYDNFVPVIIVPWYNIDSTNTFSYKGIGNKMNGIFTSEVETTMNSGSISWVENEVPIVLQADITINDGTKLEFADGVVIKACSKTQIIIKQGAIFDQSNKDVYFTSYKDDVHGGDTNGDGAATYPKDDDWIGINDNSIWWGGYHVLYDSH